MLAATTCKRSACPPSRSLCFCQHPRRLFSSSPRSEDHYTTLGVPHNATKSQIKSNFYKLSKEHHPDLSKNSESPAIYEAIRSAYDVLGDDRSRRLYDRSRLPASNAGSGSSSHYARTTDTHRGATHAWQRARHGPSSYTHPSGSTRHRPPGQGSGAPNYHYTPPNRRADPYNRTRPDTAADRVSRESNFWRATQVIGGILLATAVGVRLARG